MRRFGSCIAILAFVSSSVGLAAQAPNAPTIRLPGREKFAAAPAPLPAGAMLAVLSGDPYKVGSQFASNCLTARRSPRTRTVIPKT